MKTKDINNYGKSDVIDLILNQILLIKEIETNKKLLKKINDGSPDSFDAVLEQTLIKRIKYTYKSQFD